MSAAAAEPFDANTRRFLRRAGRPLTVLADPSSAAVARPADAPDLLPLRTLARDVRQHTVDHLDVYLSAATEAVTRAGGHVHHAADAADARRLVARLAPSATVRPSAVCDEIGLASGGGPALVIGASFVVAETGQVCLTSNEPVASPAALVCVAGLESVVPRTADLAVLLKLLARTAGPATAYAALIGPTPGGRPFHLVLLDNGRTDLLAGEHRPLLRCIGCGACTRVCPVYRSAGVAPAGLWAGPIGAAVLPLLRPAAAELPHASTLCGACADACPVRIDLPAHLIALRSTAPRLAIRLRLWGWAMLSPTRFHWARRLARLRVRDPFPRPARRSFQTLWRERP